MKELKYEIIDFLEDMDEKLEYPTLFKYHLGTIQAELSHRLDHVLSDLDVEPWTDYSHDFDLVKEKIDSAIEQIEFIQKKYLGQI